jgi:hypothetical protein
MDSCISPQGRHRPLECKPSSPCGFCTKHHASHGQRRARLVCCTKEGRAYGEARVKSSAVHRAFDALVLKLSDEFNDEISETMTDSSAGSEAANAGADAAAAATISAAVTAVTPQHSTEAASPSPLRICEESAAAAASAHDEQAASSQPARSTRARTAVAEPVAPLTRARRNQKLVEQIAAASSTPPSTVPGRSAKRQRDARGAFLPSQAQSAKKVSKKRCVCSCT